MEDLRMASVWVYRGIYMKRELNVMLKSQLTYKNLSFAYFRSVLDGVLTTKEKTG